MSKRLKNRCRRPINVTLLFCAMGASYAYSQALTDAEDPISLFDALKATLEGNPTLVTEGLVTSITKKSIEVEEAAFNIDLSGQGAIGKYERPQMIEGGAVLGLDSDEQNYSLTARKVSRTGQLLEASLRSSAIASKVRGVELERSSSISAGLAITFPLWRGRGGRLTQLPLNVAKQDFETQSYILRYKTGGALTRTITEYWQYKGAVDALTSYKAAEATSRRSLELVEELAEADEIAASELLLVREQLSRRVASRIQAEQNILQSWAGLSEAIGKPDYSSRMSYPASDFPVPKIDSVKRISEINVQKVIADLVENRSDFLAIRSKVKADEYRAGLAEDATNPTVNLRIGAESQVFQPADSLFRAIEGQSFGPDVSIALNYSYSFGMRAEKARAAIARLTVQQSKVELVENERSRVVDLVNSLKNFSRSIERYNETYRQRELSNKSLRNERRKLVLGLSTVIDVTRVEDRLLAAELEVLNAKVSMGSAIAGLMFSSGYLDSLIASGALNYGFNDIDIILDTLLENT